MSLSCHCHEGRLSSRGGRRHWHASWAHIWALWAVGACISTTMTFCTPLLIRSQQSWHTQAPSSTAKYHGSTSLVQLHPFHTWQARTSDTALNSVSIPFEVHSIDWRSIDDAMQGKLLAIGRLLGLAGRTLDSDTGGGMFRPCGAALRGVAEGIKRGTWQEVDEFMSAMRLQCVNLLPRSQLDMLHTQLTSSPVMARGWQTLTRISTTLERQAKRLGAEDESVEDCLIDASCAFRAAARVLQA